MKIKFYGFLTLVFFPFYKSPANSSFFEILKKLINFYLNSRFFKKLAWSVLIIAEKTLSSTFFLTRF